jgi:hypothetical protein
MATILRIFNAAEIGIFLKLVKGKVVLAYSQGDDFQKMLFIFMILRVKERRVTTDIYDVP